MIDWIRSNQTLLWWLFGLSAAMFLIVLAAVPFIVVRMHPDHFCGHVPAPESWRGQHPALRITFRVLKNGAGAVFVLTGVAMLLLPGPGIMSILIGITLLEFPGKGSLELRIVRRRPVLGAINWIRARAGRQPLRLP